MLLSPRKNGLDSLFKEVRVFKEVPSSLGGIWGGGLVCELSEPIAAPKTQKLAEMKLKKFRHKTWNDKLGGIWGEDLWVIQHSK